MKKKTNKRPESSLNEEIRYVKAKLAEVKRKWDTERDEIECAAHRRTYQSLADTLAKLERVASSDTTTGLMLSPEEVEKTWSRAVAELKVELLRIPNRCARSSFFAKFNDPVGVEQHIGHEINTALAHLTKEEEPAPPAPYTGPSSGCAPEMQAFHAFYAEMCKKYGNDEPIKWSAKDRALLKSLRAKR